MDEKAQVSLEYLLTVTFAIILTIAVAILVVYIGGLADDKKAEIINYRRDTVGELMG